MLDEVGKVQSVFSTTVPHTENRLVVSTFQTVSITLAVGVEAIRCIGISGFGIYAINTLDRRDIIHHWRGRQEVIEIITRPMKFGKITHHRARPGILGVIGVVIVTATTVVTARVFKANGMAQFMHRDKWKITAQLWITLCVLSTNICRYIGEVFQRECRHTAASIGYILYSY